MVLTAWVSDVVSPVRDHVPPFPELVCSKLLTALHDPTDAGARRLSAAVAERVRHVNVGVTGMQNRKFGARHLQLIEQQYNYVVDRDDAIAVRGVLLRTHACWVVDVRLLSHALCCVCVAGFRVLQAGLSLRQFKGLLKQLGKSDPIFKVVDHGIGVSVRWFMLLV